MLHSRSEIIGRATGEFALLDGLVSQISGEAWALPAPRRDGEDAWTVKDVLSHITARKGDFVAEIGGSVRSRGGVGVHAYNRATFEAWHDRPVEDLIAWHRHVQRELLEALSAAPETWFVRETPRLWPAAVDGHSAHHRKLDLERALKKHAKRARGV